MVKNKFYLLFNFLVILLILTSGVYSYAQTEPLTGLRFSSHEVIKDKRTSLNLTPEGPFTFPEGFSMEFEAQFRPGDGHFGSIFRIIGNDTVNIDLVSNFWSPSTTFSLVYKDNELFTYNWEEIPDGSFGSWIKIKLEVDKDSNLIISLNGNSKQKQIKEIADLQNFQIEFGACRISSFLTTDVSPMTVKNILIFDESQEIQRKWLLAKHRENYVLDEFTLAKAVVQNPNWEIDKHLDWKKERSFQVNNLLGIATDEETGRVFLVDNQAVYVCKMADFTIDTVENISIDTLSFTKGMPFPCQGNQVIYNSLTDEIWSYNFSMDKVSKFDFETRSWSLSDQECLTPSLWHHSSFLSPLDTTLITFGGYGFYTYKSFFNRYSLQTEDWEQLNLINHIPPRYMSGMGPLNKEKVLIFGGYGSLSGRQEISPNFYYDLYSMDSEGMIPEKLWELDSVESPFVPTHTLIPDSASNSFYTLIYNPASFETSLTLAKFNVDKPDRTFYADSIPYKFLDTESWSTLFLNKESSKLVALTRYNNQVDLYSLAYPPLLPEDVYQEQKVAIGKMNGWSGFVMGGLGILIIALLLIWKKTEKSRLLKKTPVPEPKDEGPVQIIESNQGQRNTISSVYLLGGFQVFDQEGNDVTSNFTPTLKQLFLLIFLSSIQNGKGISSSKLDEILWFDKSEESARNNRNVNISKLRVLFKTIGQIDLEYNSTSWKVTFGNQFYSDYTEAWQLIKKSKSPSGLSEKEILKLVQVVSSGELCPNIQTEWMDKFKVDFANELINTLTEITTHLDEQNANNQELLLAISDCILRFDILNEEAIVVKCSALFHLGKTTFAKQSYDHFCREYKQLLGEDFALPFKDLVK